MASRRSSTNVKASSRCTACGIVLSLVACALAACSVSGQGTWWQPKTPKLQVIVSAGCPHSDTGVADVVNTFRGPPLVPPDPTAGLICRYGARVGSGLPNSGELIRSKLLGPQD